MVIIRSTFWGGIPHFEFVGAITHILDFKTTILTNGIWGCHTTFCDYKKFAYTILGFRGSTANLGI